MAQRLFRLTAIAVKRLTKPGRHADGGGLYLLVKPTGARSWVFLFKVRGGGGRQRELGLGSADAITLQRARERAQELRAMLAEGQEPSLAVAAPAPTFGVLASEVVVSLESGWRNPKHRAQWRMTLDVYAAPLAGIPVDQITTDHVMSCLRPIWQTKPETASRVRGRIEKVLDAAKVRGLRGGDNPARWRGHLDHLLPKPQKLSRGHHTAMAWGDLQAFMGRLAERRAVAAAALEFTILTAARTAETIGVTWDEIDQERAIWTVPAARMKAGRDHRVPLQARALRILAEMQQLGSRWVFPHDDREKPLSNMAMTMLLRRMGVVVTVHGFRSTFRDWVSEATEYPDSLAEAALAHITGDKVEQAYKRGDALDRRRAMMEAWASFLAPQPSANAPSIATASPMQNAL